MDCRVFCVLLWQNSLAEPYPRVIVQYSYLWNKLWCHKNPFLGTGIHFRLGLCKSIGTVFVDNNSKLILLWTSQINVGLRQHHVKHKWISRESSQTSGGHLGFGKKAKALDIHVHFCGFSHATCIHSFITLFIFSFHLGCNFFYCCVVWESQSVSEYPPHLWNYLISSVPSLHVPLWLHLVNWFGKHY